MRINCAICLDLLTPSSEVSAGPCGHVFHTGCFTTWLTTNKSSCPACRKSCPEKQLRRIYFSETDAPSDEGGASQSSDDLVNKISSLTFELRIAERDKRQAAEERDKMKAQNVALREEFRALEVKVQSAKDEMYTANQKIKLLKGEKRKIDLLENELEQTKQKLELFKTIDLAVKGSMEECTQRLHQIGDYSQAAKELSLVCMSLKKELKNKNDYESELQKKLVHKSRKISDLKSQLETQSRELKQLTIQNHSLSAEVKHLEEDLKVTQEKMSRLQEAVASPSGDFKSSVINRLLHEFPAPANMSPATPSESRRFTSPTETKTKQHFPDLFELSDDSGGKNPPTKRMKTTSMASPCKEVTNRLEPSKFIKSSSASGGSLIGLLGSMSSQEFRCEPKKPGLSDEMTYNGFGGHSKSDNFPQPLKRDAFKTKKPKGVSRAAAATVRPKGPLAAATSGSQKIDKFFNLNTP